MLWKPTLKFFSGDSTALGIAVGAATVWSYTMSGEPPYRPPAPMCCSPTPDMSRSQKCLRQCVAHMHAVQVRVTPPVTQEGTHGTHRNVRKASVDNGVPATLNVGNDVDRRSRSESAVPCCMPYAPSMKNCSNTTAGRRRYDLNDVVMLVLPGATKRQCALSR